MGRKMLQLKNLSLHRCIVTPLLIFILSASLGACSVYHPTVSQGNVVTSNMVAQLKRGMASVDVLQIMGTPLVASIFHPDRWEYVFTLKQNGKLTQSRRLTLFFQDNQLVSIAGDQMPSEQQFLAQILQEQNAAGLASWLSTGSPLEADIIEGNTPILETVANQDLYEQPEDVSVDITAP